MKKKKLISLLLSLSIIGTMMMPGTTVFAAGGTDASGSTDTSGMEISKTATANDDGTYTVQLEAYATGSKVISQVTKDVPTDIVLVLDESGSMGDPIGAVVFTQYEDYYTNSDYYDLRHNGGTGNLYYPIGSGNYASVSVVRQSQDTYSAISGWSNSDYYSNSNNLYARVKGVYEKVSVTYKWSNRSLRYTYTLPNGNSIAISYGYDATPTFSGIDGNVLYLRDTNYTYTYTYTDASNATHIIGTSPGAYTAYSPAFYEKSIDQTAGVSRISALQTALTNFTAAVTAKAAGKDGISGNADDVNHRIAVVGYASNGNYSWTNTELFDGATQYNYSVDAYSHYASAFQDMNTTAGQNKVAASIWALDANGATYTNYGMEMASSILTANPVAEGQQRNRVVILFTDGYPGYNAQNFDSDAASSAISYANAAEKAGATVYSVGIFAGANPTTAGSTASGSSNTDKANWFMQNVSSNNGTPQTPSYYLSASDAASLNNIFQQISNQIETGGSSTTLSNETVIKDIISTPFKLPAGTTASDITLETYSYTGNNTAGEKLWSKNNSAMGATASISGDESDQINVTGFNYAENYVGTVTDAAGTVSYRGDKLVVKFNVIPKDAFLGGNNVFTNTSAGIYAKAAATTPVLTFEQPQVNVPIKNVTVTAQDKNVYLTGDLTGAQLLSGATVQVGSVALDLTKENYGLETWQTEHVDISVALTDQNGVTVTNLSDLSSDQVYHVTATVSPKTAGANASGTAATAKTGSASGTINVFKPELTFQDSTVYYGEAVPTDFSGNLTSTKWKHGSTEADPSTMGTAPTLNLTYAVDSTKVLNNKINSKQDIDVDATVKIGDADVTASTRFLHTNCAGGCSWSVANPNGSPAFLLHVKTCDLTIQKTGGADNEPYVFTIYKDGTKYTEATIVGNSSVTISELPVGTYAVQEDGNWSWRYTAAYTADQTLSAKAPSGSITCTNTKDDNNWFNGFSAVVKNIFGSTN